MNKYWSQRQSDITYNRVLKMADEKLAYEYERCFRATQGRLKDTYDEIIEASVDGTLLISDLYKYNRYYELMNVLNRSLNRLGQKEIEIYEDCFRQMYLTNSQLITDELGYYKSSQLFTDDNAIKRVIESVWCQDGKHWSSRIWTNKSALQERIKNGLVDCIARGVSKDELIKTLRDDMQVGFREASRIARTELTFVQNQSTLDKFREAGIEYYEFLAELDDRTSDVCREKNGQIFRVSEAQVGINIPPLHPNCRSTIVAVRR